MATPLELDLGTGLLFVNPNKEKEKQPDLRGSLKTVHGEMIEIAGWYRKSKNGGKEFIYLKQSEPNTTPPRNTPKPYYEGARGGKFAEKEVDDEIPF